MRTLLSLCVTLGVLCFGFLASTPAQALQFRTYVSAGGADANPCTLASPCATIAHAVTQTTGGGILACLDANDYSSPTVNITVSLTIDCSQFGSGFGPFSVNTAGVTVVIKGGVIFDQGVPGIDFKAGAAVFVERVQISNVADGIFFEPTSLGAKLVVSDSLIFSNAHGVHVKPAAGIQANVTVDHTTLENNANNGFFCDGSAGGACVAVVSNSNVSGNGTAGIAESAAGGSVSVLVDNTSVASNPVGLLGSAGTGMLVRRSSIVVNGTGISPSGGLIFSYGDNTVNANGTDGSFSSNIPLK